MNAASTPRIDLAIIGAQKSATTAMQYYLHDHPGVDLPLGELACFESPDYEQGRVARQITWQDQADDMLYGIKRPTIFSDIVAIDRLRGYAPGCKLIMVCRDPVARFVSAYFHLMNSGKLPVMDINKAIPQMFAGRYLSKHTPGLSLLRNGIYHPALAHITARYGHDALFAVSHERISTQFDTVMQELCGFLDIAHVPAPAAQEKREKNRGSYDYRRAAFLKLPNALKYSYSRDRTRKEYRSATAARLVGGGLSRLVSHAPFTNPVDPADLMQAESEQLLRAYYETDKQKLQEDFADLMYW